MFILKVETHKLAITIKNWPSKYFKPEEVLSPGSINLYLTSGFVNLDYEALKVLEELRDFIDVILYVNYSGLHFRGTRTPAENQTIKGAAHNSAHVLGKAFDITAKDLTAKELYGKVIAFHEATGKISGIGLYPTWVHFDTAWRPNTKLTIWNRENPQ